MWVERDRISDYLKGTASWEKSKKEQIVLYKILQNYLGTCTSTNTRSKGRKGKDERVKIRKRNGKKDEDTLPGFNFAHATANNSSAYCPNMDLIDYS